MRSASSPILLPMIRALPPLRRVSWGNARAGEHGFPGIPLHACRERRYRIAGGSDRPERAGTVRTFANGRVLRESCASSFSSRLFHQKSQRVRGKDRWRARVRRSNKHSGSPRSVTTRRASTSSAPAHGSRRPRSRSTAGRGTTSLDSRARVRRSAAGWRSPAIIQAAPDRGRAAGRPRQGPVTDPRHSSAQPPCPVRRDRGQAGRAERARAVSLPQLDRVGRKRRMGIDFNPTYFAHPRAADGRTLTHPDEAVRRFWVEHGIACRRIGRAIGAALGSPCVTNVWIPDGSKDTPVDRRGPRAAGPLSRRGLRRADRRG